MVPGPVMSSLHPFSKLGLVLNSPEPALICRHQECRYVLQPAIKRMHSHLWEKHGITKDERRGLTACLRSLQLADLRQLPPRKDGSEIHTDLTRQRGYVCRPCGERSTSVKLIDKHVRERHGADYPRQARDLYQLRDKVYMQSGSRRYWIIRGPSHRHTSQRSTRQGVHLQREASGALGGPTIDVSAKIMKDLGHGTQTGTASKSAMGVKRAIVAEDGHTIKDDFAQTFCTENGMSGVDEEVLALERQQTSRFHGGVSGQRRRGAQHVSEPIGENWRFNRIHARVPEVLQSDQV